VGLGDALADGDGLALGLGETLGLADGDGLALGLGEALGLALADGDALGLGEALGLALADADGLALGDGWGGNCPVISVTPSPRRTSRIWFPNVAEVPPANNNPIAFDDDLSSINEPESPESLNFFPPSPEITIWPLNLSTPMSYWTFTSVSILVMRPVV
jgi:hypothetical protein